MIVTSFIPYKFKEDGITIYTVEKIMLETDTTLIHVPQDKLGITFPLIDLSSRRSP